MDFDNTNNVTLTHEQLAQLVREAGAKGHPFSGKFNPAAAAVANNPVKTLKGTGIAVVVGCMLWGFGIAQANDFDSDKVNQAAAVAPAPEGALGK